LNQGIDPESIVQLEIATGFGYGTVGEGLNLDEAAGPEDIVGYGLCQAVPVDPSNNHQDQDYGQGHGGPRFCAGFQPLPVGSA
jgi:hypothetical protein